MVLPRETLVDVFSHFGVRSLVIVQLSNRTFDSVIRANKEHLARARRYRLYCENGRVRLYPIRDADVGTDIVVPVYESNWNLSVEESLRRVKELLNTIEVEADVHPITNASFAYAVWPELPSTALISCLPSLEYAGNLTLSCQVAHYSPGTDWSLIDYFIEPFTGLRLLRLPVFDDVDWKFLRGANILKLHRIVFENFSNPLFNTIRNRSAEIEVFRYCFDNSKFPRLDKPLASYFKAWKFSAELIDRVIKKAEAVSFKVYISLTVSEELRFDEDLFDPSCSPYRCYSCDKSAVVHMCGGRTCRIGTPLDDRR